MKREKPTKKIWAKIRLFSFVFENDAKDLTQKTSHRWIRNFYAASKKCFKNICKNSPSYFHIHSVMYQREHTSSSIFLIVPPSIAVMPAPLTALSNVSNKNTEIKMEDSSIDCELLIDRSFRSILLKIYTKKMKTYSKNDF